MKRIRNIVLVAVVAFLLIAVGGLLFVTRQQGIALMNPPRSFATQTPADFGMATYENVQLVTEDGLTLQGWFVPPASQADGAVLIYVHGLASNRSLLLAQAQLTYEERGYGAFLFDLRGHGDSEGEVTTLAADEPRDVAAVLDYLLTRDDVNADQIGLIGESLGGATALRAAVQLPQIRVVVAQCAYSSLEDNVSEGVRRLTGLPPFPFAPLVIFFAEREGGISLNDVRPVDEIGQLAPRPVLLMHGDADELIDVANSRRLYEAAGDPRELVIFPGALHGGLHNANPDLFAASLLSFLDAHMGVGIEAAEVVN